MRPRIDYPLPTAADQLPARWRPDTCPLRTPHDDRADMESHGQCSGGQLGFCDIRSPTTALISASSNGISYSSAGHQCVARDYRGCALELYAQKAAERVVGPVHIGVMSVVIGSSNTALTVANSLFLHMVIMTTFVSWAACSLDRAASRRSS